MSGSKYVKIQLKNFEKAYIMVENRGFRRARICYSRSVLSIVNFRVNRTLYIGSVRKPNLPGYDRMPLIPKLGRC